VELSRGDTDGSSPRDFSITSRFAAAKDEVLLECRTPTVAVSLWCGRRRRARASAEQARKQVPLAQLAPYACLVRSRDHPSLQAIALHHIDDRPFELLRIRPTV